MKKLLIFILSICSLASFAQSGSVSYSGVFTRVNDSTAYQAAAATKHAQGYADIYYNNQATTPHHDVWNGSSYDHIFNFASGGSGGTQDLQDVLNTGSILTDPVVIDGTGTNPTWEMTDLGHIDIGNLGHINIVAGSGAVLESGTVRVGQTSGGNLTTQSSGATLTQGDRTISAGTDITLTRGSGQIKLAGTLPVLDTAAYVLAIKNSDKSVVRRAVSSISGGGGSGTVDPGTVGDIAVYTGTTTVDGTTAIPNGITATTQSIGDVTEKVTTNLFVRENTANVYNVEAYGAMHDYQTVSTASITSGTDALTTSGAAFVAGDVGKSIRVFGAGAAGADLLTTIDGYTNSTTISIATNASTSITTKQIEWGSDDTQEIQAAIDAAFTAGGGTVYFPNGRYLLFGALVTSVNSINPNCQIYIPLVVAPDTRNTISLMGESQAPMIWGPFSSLPQPTTGVQLISVIVGSGTLPSVIGSSFSFDGFVNSNTLLAKIENITIRVKSLTGTTHIAPIMTAFNFGYLSGKQVKNCYAYTESNPTVSIEPVAETYGFYLSQNSHDDMHSFYENLDVSGYYYGFRMEEHDSWTRLNAWNCYSAVVLEGNGTGHPIISWGTIGNWWCKYGVTFLEDIEIAFNYTAERWPGSIGTTRWFDGVADFYYPSSVEINGKINGSVDLAGGTAATLVQSGTNTGKLVITDLSDGTTIGAIKSISYTSSVNDMLTLSSTGSEQLKITGSASASRIGSLSVAEHSSSFSAHIVTNDRHAGSAFSSFGAFTYWGSASSQTFGGLSGADKLAIYATGASNTGIVFGTLTAQPISLFTNDIERFRVGPAGQLGIGGATYGTAGQEFISGGPSAAPAWTTKANAVADGATKGVAAFTAADFDASSGVISLDYTNGQAASASNKGFLTSANWSTFNAKADRALTHNTQTGSYTLVLTDADSKIVEMNVGSANNLTVPLNSTVAFPIGTQIPIVQYGAGVTTIVATGGVTINSTSASLVAPAQYAPMVLEKRGTDEWYLWGTGSDNISATTITSTISTESTNVVQSSGDITHKYFKTRWIDAAGTSITQDRNILNGYTDATATVVFTVVGVKSDGSESTGAQYAATFNKDGGTTVVEVGSETQIYHHETDAATTVTISVSSNLIRVVVDSGDADSYQWTVFADVTITEL